MSVARVDLPPPVYPRRRQLLFGSAFAAAACGMFLFTVVGQYLSARSDAGDTWLSENSIPLAQPNVILFTLLMSAVTAQWAVYSIARDDRGHTYLALGMTLMFGLAVVVQSWFLYTQVELGIDRAEGGLFYAVTGGHLAMVVAGLVFFALVGLRALGGSYSSAYPDGVSAAALFWHVTVGLYMVVWLAVYIMK
jgi:heme/copper-type cytochrome/quinol oxidase subunit 3